MQFTLKRTTRTDNSTIGELSIDGGFFCYTLEDKDRGLLQTDTPESIKARKVYAQTAIPAGTYELIMNFSNRFQKYMPLLINVPGYEGVRIHVGNTPKDTEGCILVGKQKGSDFVGMSRTAYEALLVAIRKVERTEKIFITVS